MRHFVFTGLFLFVPLFFSLDGLAQGGPVGAGIVIGEPTGLTAKFRLNQRHAADLAISWKSGDDGNFYLHSTYQWIFTDQMKIEDELFDPYVGAGVRVREQREGPPERDSELQFALRFAGGVAYRFKDPAFEPFVELAILMNLVPDTGFGAGFGLGVRYFF